MTLRSYHIEFLTPCFCAGADQTRAELRPAAIRGQLRWWFRCLGGTADEERTIFGGVHGENPTSSIFNIRIRKQPTGGQGDWHNKIPQQGVEPRAYLLGFFCGRTDRLNPKGALPPGSQALIDIIFKRQPPPLLEQALRLFFSVGALGFRVSRTAGAVTSAEHALTELDWNSLAAELHAKNFHVALGSECFDDWVSLIRCAGDLLKNKIRGRDGLGISAGRNGSNPNALGSAEPRQASVLHLRPVRIDKRLRLALIEAPHVRILGQPASRAHANRGSIIMLARGRHIVQP